MTVEKRKIALACGTKAWRIGPIASDIIIFFFNKEENPRMSETIWKTELR